MSITFECSIKEDVVEKFNLALILNKEEADDVIEKYMMQYISSSFSKASKTYKAPPTSKIPRVIDVMNIDMGKAKNRIPKWALKAEQYNHKIVRAYFQVEREFGHVPLDELEKRCSDEVTFPTTYVRDFRGNFNQMKIDAPKSHGKVFEIDNGNVVIWDYVKETLMKNKVYFCR